MQPKEDAQRLLAREGQSLHQAGLELFVQSLPTKDDAVFRC